MIPLGNCAISLAQCFLAFSMDIEGFSFASFLAHSSTLLVRTLSSLKAQSALLHIIKEETTAMALRVEIINPSSYLCSTHMQEMVAYMNRWVVFFNLNLRAFFRY